MRTRKQGVILIVSLLLVMSIAVLGRVAIALNPGMLAMSASSSTQQSAIRAADSGLQYALNRLREDPSWKAQTVSTVVSTPQLTIVEGHGNVIGLSIDPDGSKSQFRIRFNFQDGDGGGDGLSDPTPEMWVDHSYVSVNNVESTAIATVPRADGPNFSVVDPTVGPTEVPGNTVAILVEGRAGPGLADVASTAPNAALTGSVRTTVSESLFRLGLDQAVKDAALMAGGNVKIVVPPTSFASLAANSETEIVPRVRSKGSVEILNPDSSVGTMVVYGERGEIGYDNTSAAGLVADLTGNGADPVQESVGDGEDFYNLDWDDVLKADPNPASTDTVHIPAGTYVMWDDDSIHYYEMNFGDYKTYMSDPGNHSDPGVALSWDFREVRSSQNASVSGIANWTNADGNFNLGFSSDTHVEPVGSGPTQVSDFTIMTRGGTAYSPTDDNEVVPGAADSYTNNDVTVSMEGALISAPGDVRMLTKLKARASTITAEGQFTAVAPATAMLENSVTGEQGLNLYAIGDINLSSYRGSSDRFGDMHFRGLVYTWGDFEALSGHPDTAIDRWSNSSFWGAIVAYGDDPASGSPGASGTGAVNITSEEVSLKNNTDKLSSVLDLESGNVPTTMEQILFSNYR